VAERVRGLVLTDKVQVKSPDKKAIIIRAGQVFGALNAATKFILLQSACCCGGPHDFAYIDRITRNSGPDSFQEIICVTRMSHTMMGRAEMPDVVV